MERFVKMLLVFIALIVGCEGDQAYNYDSSTTDSGLTEYGELSEEQALEIAEAIIDGDKHAADSLSADDLDIFIDVLQAHNIYPDLEDEAVVPPSTLPYCGGYWGADHEVERVEEKRYGSSLYEVGANCYMWAPGDDCGDDYDDFMLSFYFGNHAESRSTLANMLKWNSTNWWVHSLLGKLSVRLYEESEGGGRDNYNIYACIDDYYDPYLTTFKMRKF